VGGGPRPKLVGADGRPLPFDTLCALLERAGYRRHEVGRLTRRYVARVLWHPRDAGGGVDTAALQPPPPDPPRPGDDVREWLRPKGWPGWRVEARVREELEKRHG
jgi:hypothetical protein